MSWFLGWVSYIAFEYLYFGTMFTFLIYYNQEDRDPSDATMVFGLWPVELYTFLITFPEKIAVFAKRMQERRAEQAEQATQTEYSRAVNEQKGGAAEAADTQSL